MSNIKPKLLYIDDERYFARDYVSALSAAFEVYFCEDVDEARRLLCDPRHCFSAAVVDLQMPPPQNLPDNVVVESVDSGLWLLEQAFDTIVIRPLPIIILTNREFPTFRERFESTIWPDKLVEVHIKYDTSSRKLAGILDEMVKYWRGDLDLPR